MRSSWPAVLLLLAACSGPATVAGPTPTPLPTPLATVTPGVSPTPAATMPVPAWVVGASPLPRGRNGFGEVQPTPAVLRDRRLPTKDLLPPPADGRFHVRVAAVTPALRSRMGETYRPGCPVAPSGLRHVVLTFRGFDGRAHTGELVVAARAVGPVTSAFRELFRIGFPLEEMRLPTTDDLRAAPTGDGNDTAAFVCRAARGQTRFSAHAYGLAVDVNPFHNPYAKGDLVLPELASSYLDRTRVRPGMLLRRSAAVRAFTRVGFTWGGDFRSLKDYQHFSLTGD